ncbi:MAG: hypothetical protein WAM07_11490 [Halobacillus sp.]|uniref:hypothetical protein n=1 Tax=Halobacillus sp. TaxID=56800 RepID=UPI003BAF1E1C
MTRISFHNLTVDQVSNSSGIYSGTNVQSRFSAHRQKNEGNGMIIGNKNVLQQNRHLIIKKPNPHGE